MQPTSTKAAPDLENKYDQIKVYVMYKAMYMQFCINEVHYLTSF